MPKFFYGILFAIIAIVVVFVFTKPSPENPDTTEELLSEITTENTPDIPYPTIVLDAGHGGHQ